MRARKVLTRFYLLEDKTHKKLGNVPRRDDVSKQKTLLTQKRSPGLKKKCIGLFTKRKKCKNENISLCSLCSFCAWWANKRKPEKREIRSPFGKKKNARARLYHYKKKAQLSRRQRRQQQKQRRVKRLFIHDAVQTDRFSIRGRRNRDRERDRRIPVIREKSIKSSALGKG